MKCKICECVEDAHIYYWQCPLLNNELICVDCCWSIANREKFEEFDQKLKQLGITDLSKCKECGKNGLSDNNLPTT